MRKIIDKILKKQSYMDKAWVKVSYWEERRDKSREELKEYLAKKNLLKIGNVIDCGDRVIIVKHDLMGKANIEIKEKTICKN